MRLGLLLFFMGLLNAMFGQKVYIAKSEYNADYTVYPTSNSYTADLIIYVTDNRYEVGKGIWFITENRF